MTNAVQTPSEGLLDPCDEIEHLRYLGKLSAAIRCARAAITSPLHAPKVRLLLVRCLLLQGCFQEADNECQRALEILPPESELAQEMRLWGAFLQIYTRGDLIPSITEGRAALERVRSYAGSQRHTAQVKVLLGKALAPAADWGIVPATEMAVARSLLAEAVASYRELGLLDESLNALLFLGQLHLMGRDADPAAARTIFLEAHDQAQAERNLVRLAEAMLRLAELDFAATQGNGTYTLEELYHYPPHHQAYKLYEEAGYAPGPADVWLSLGSRLLGIGSDGTPLLEQALNLYHQQEHLIGIQSVVSVLGIWFVEHGKPQIALEYLYQHERVTQEMGFSMGQGRAALGLGDYFYRNSEYAKALAYYEKAERLAVVPLAKAMVELGLANVYTRMRQTERAKEASQNAITILAPAGPSEPLSLARYILGNVLSSQGDWGGALAAWRDGLADDEARHDYLSQALKVQCIAQATAMQHYRPAGPGIPEAAYEEAMALYAQSIRLLEGRRTLQIDAVIANTYQLQGQTAHVCGHTETAVQYLEQAARMYSALDLEMQAAITNTLIGLLCYDLGKRGDAALYVEAVRHYEQGLAYFKKASMLDMSWKVLLYLALTAFHQGRYVQGAEEQQAYWRATIQYLEEAGNAVELVRGRFIEADPVTAQAARLSLVSDKEQIYVNAIQIYYYFLHDTVGAFVWLERLKGRAFLDALALTALRPPVLIDDTLMDQERRLLATLAQTTTQTRVVEVNEQLRALWQQMSNVHEATVAEYVLLRRGEPVGWTEILRMLRMEEVDAPEATWQEGL